MMTVGTDSETSRFKSPVSRRIAQSPRHPATQGSTKTRKKRGNSLKPEDATRGGSSSKRRSGVHKPETIDSWLKANTHLQYPTVHRVTGNFERGSCNAHLKEELGHVLHKCLHDVTMMQPVDPIEYMARWLYRYVDNQIYYGEKAAFEMALEQEKKASKIERENTDKHKQFMETSKILNNLNVRLLVQIQERNRQAELTTSSSRAEHLQVLREVVAQQQQERRRKKQRMLRFDKPIEEKELEQSSSSSGLTSPELQFGEEMEVKGVPSQFSSTESSEESSESSSQTSSTTTSEEEEESDGDFQKAFVSLLEKAELEGSTVTRGAASRRYKKLSKVEKDKKHTHISTSGKPVVKKIGDLFSDAGKMKAKHMLRRTQRKDKTALLQIGSSKKKTKKTEPKKHGSKKMSSFSDVSSSLDLSATETTSSTESKSSAGDFSTAGSAVPSDSISEEHRISQQEEEIRKHKEKRLVRDAKSDNIKVKISTEDVAWTEDEIRHESEKETRKGQVKRERDDRDTDNIKVEISTEDVAWTEDEIRHEGEKETRKGQVKRERDDRDTDMKEELKEELLTEKKDVEAEHGRRMKHSKTKEQADGENEEEMQIYKEREDEDSGEDVEYKEKKKKIQPDSYRTEREKDEKDIAGVNYDRVKKEKAEIVDRKKQSTQKKLAKETEEETEEETDEETVTDEYEMVEGERSRSRKKEKAGKIDKKEPVKREEKRIRSRNYKRFMEMEEAEKQERQDKVKQIIEEQTAREEEREKGEKENRVILEIERRKAAMLEIKRMELKEKKETMEKKIMELKRKEEKLLNDIKGPGEEKFEESVNKIDDEEFEKNVKEEFEHLLSESGEITSEFSIFLQKRRQERQEKEEQEGADFEMVVREEFEHLQTQSDRDQEDFSTFLEKKRKEKQEKEEEEFLKGATEEFREANFPSFLSRKREERQAKIEASASQQKEKEAALKQVQKTFKRDEMKLNHQAAQIHAEETKHRNEAKNINKALLRLQRREQQIRKAREAEVLRLSLEQKSRDPVEKLVELYMNLEPQLCSWEIRDWSTLVCIHPVLGEMVRPSSRDHPIFESFWYGRLMEFCCNNWYDHEIYIVCEPEFNYKHDKKLMTVDWLSEKVAQI